MHRLSVPLIAGLTLAFGARPAAAQIDYRNLDAGLPLRVEDAYPVEQYAFELSLPYGFSHAGGASTHVVAPELAYGLVPNGMVGLSVPFVAGDEHGLAAPQLFAFYNLNTETPALPALALRADVALPIGALAGDDARLELTAIATRSWGATRAHFNANAGAGAVGATLALDHTFLRHSLLAVAELGVGRPGHGARTALDAGLGARWQWTPTLVVSGGLSHRLAGGGGLALSLGLSHAFALRSLMPAAPRRESAAAPNAGGGLPQRDEQFYWPGAFNWRFLRTHPEAARLFNAFDYGHAILYELLWTGRGHPDTALAAAYDYLTTDLLVHPPRFGIAEEAVMPHYAKIAWHAKQMFDWAHVLHRQIYDAYADPRLAPAERDSLIERLTDYYLSRRDYAFAPVPKSMALMDDQYFSQAFRRRYPAFNGLIWAYHWLQVGLYEPLAADATGDLDARREAVDAVVAKFRRMLDGAPDAFPEMMPMTATIAPTFAAAHPRAAIVFDNLHMAHDIISDVLASDSIPRARKAAVIAEQMRILSDTTTAVISREEWRAMAAEMGGPAMMGGSPTAPAHHR